MAIAVQDVMFRSFGVEGRDLWVRELRATDGLSQLYDYRLTLETTAGPLTDGELDALLDELGYVAFGQDEAHKVYGVVTAVDEHPVDDPDETTSVLYDVVFAPRMTYLTRNRASRVYLDKSVLDVVRAVLERNRFERGTHFEVRARATYPVREFTLQYQESDWAFVARLLEHWGLFFFFEQTDDGGEKLVVADHTEACTALDEPASLAYRLRGGHADAAEWVEDLRLRRQVVEAAVELRDYNYRTPAVTLATRAPVDARGGRGVVAYYGDHFKDSAEGAALARVRAEELACRRVRFEGRSNCRALHAGRTFALAGHPHDARNARYLVVAVEHRAVQASPVAAGLTHARSYGASFVAQPPDVPFRPARVTPRPRIAGIVHGFIDAGTDGRHPEIDALGRYKVRLPFDLDGREGGRASRWVRMMQPYAGADHGLHFPLHKGTEVAISHLDGDPDRPVILGALPNAQTQSPVTGANANESQLRTDGGIRVRFVNHG